MSIIRIYQGKSKKAPKKPGWKQEQEAYETWLRSVQSMSLGAGRTKPKGKVQAKTVVVPATPVVPADRLNRPPSLMTPGGAGTKPVARPEVMYKDRPELLERELAARAVKHNTAPAYNKGPDIFVSEAEITKQLVGGRRR